jgi:alpha-amylase
LARLKNKTKRKTYIDEWRRLQVSDHFYYMSTKYWSDGDVHKYFSPYDSPYEAFINYMNILEDFTQRIEFESRVKNNNM